MTSKVVLKKRVGKKRRHMCEVYFGRHKRDVHENVNNF